MTRYQQRAAYAAGIEKTLATAEAGAAHFERAERLARAERLENIRRTERALNGGGLKMARF